MNKLQRVLLEREATPSVVVLDERTLQSTPQSGHRAGYEGAKTHKGSLARDYERLSASLQQLQFVVFACLVLA